MMTNHRFTYNGSLLLSAIIILGCFGTLPALYTENIPVNIQLNPARYLYGKDYVATGTKITATAEILDEKYKNLTLTYQWSTKEKTIITDTKSSQISYVFDKPDEDNFLKILVLYQSNYTGSSSKSLVIRDPINITEPEGKLFIEHGDLLDISLKVKGGQPIEYCHEFCLNKVDRETGASIMDEDCKCKPNTNLTNSEIIIKHYLRLVGNYTLLLVVDNVADHLEKHYEVKIRDTTHAQTIPYVPIVCSIVAVLILLTGVTLHMKFKRTVQTETADFDFIRTSFADDDEWAEEQSLWQRVSYLLFRADHYEGRERFD